MNINNFVIYFLKMRLNKKLRCTNKRIKIKIKYFCRSCRREFLKEIRLKKKEPSERNFCVSKKINENKVDLFIINNIFFTDNLFDIFVIKSCF